VAGTKRRRGVPWGKEDLQLFSKSKKGGNLILHIPILDKKRPLRKAEAG